MCRLLFGTLNSNHNEFLLAAERLSMKCIMSVDLAVNVEGA
jgi:hypothetical protein